MKTFVTFGQSHVHRIDGKTFDADCVAVIKCGSPEEGRDKAFELFNSKFCFEYPEQFFDHSSMSYFPRGFLMAHGECDDPGRIECDCYICDGDMQ